MLTAADVWTAAARLAGVARQTPIVTSEALDARVGARTFLKTETLQWGGSFKYRGVMNKLLARHADSAAALVAYSSGNHAVSVSMAARRRGRPAVLVMPEDAPAIKLKRVREQGGRIVSYDRACADRVALARQVCAEVDGVLFPPFEDPDVICGQATATLELIQQCRETGVELDDILLPCGGGGLLSGGMLAAQAARSAARVWAIEPQGFDRMRRSVAAGRVVENERTFGSICDALLARAPCELTLRLAMEGACRGLCPDDRAVAAAVAFAFEELKLVVEPSGAIALAAAMTTPDPFAGRSVGIVLSGGNVDPATLAAALEQG